MKSDNGRHEPDVRLRAPGKLVPLEAGNSRGNRFLVEAGIVRTSIAGTLGVLASLENHAENAFIGKIRPTAFRADFVTEIESVSWSK